MAALRFNDGARAAWAGGSKNLPQSLGNRQSANTW
jgi:hypothetical protein